MASTPELVLSRVAERYPKFWKNFDRFRESRGKNGFPDWPPWCYCPLAASYAVVSGGSSRLLSADEATMIGVLGAVSAWRPTKGIYRFDPDLASAIVSTPLQRELPVESLLRIPEWCMWVDPVVGLPGFFAHLESDANDGRIELRLTIPTDTGAIPIALHLGSGSLVDALRAWSDEATAQHVMRQAQWVPPSLPDQELSRLANRLSPLVSLVLYLCAEEPDYGDRTPPAHPSRPGARTAGAQAVTEWPVGERIGAALRRATEDERGEPGDGTHAGPRPHVRRAHWHTYWTGPRGAQTVRLRWLSPILVGAGETVPTVHGVE